MTIRISEGELLFAVINIAIVLAIIGVAWFIASRLPALLEPLFRKNPAKKERLLVTGRHTPLTQAAANEDLEMVKDLVDRKTDVNARGDEGDTALALAAWRSNLEMVRLLLEHGADPNIRNDKNGGESPLGLAVTGVGPDEARPEIVRMLLDRGADPNCLGMYGEPVIIAAAKMSCNIVFLRMLLEAKADVNRTNTTGETALIAAADAGIVENVSLVLEHGANAGARNNAGETALARALLRLQAPPNDNSGHPERRYYETAKLLIGHGAPLPVEPELQNALLFAVVYAGNVQSASDLLKNAADVNALYGENKETLLMKAAEGGSAEMVDLLVSRGARVEEKNVIGTTALMYGAMEGHSYVVWILLNRGADPSAATENGETGLLWAASKGHLDVAGLLRGRGADINRRNKWGKTALMYAVRDGNVKAVNYILAHGGDVSLRDNEGLTALHVAVSLSRDPGIGMYPELVWKDGSREVLKTLLAAKGSDVNAKTAAGSTPLMLAVDKVDVVNLLIENGADLNAQDEDGNTALMHTVKEGLAGITELLIEKGAALDLKNNKEWTALRWAREKKQEYIANLLAAAGAKE